MKLPKLTNWTETRSTLHQVVRIIGAIRVASSDELNNDLQYSLAIIDGGVSSTALKVGGELLFKFDSLIVKYIRDEKTLFEIDAKNHSQVSLMQAILTAFSEQDIHLEPSMKHITGEDLFHVDMTVAQDYASLLDNLYTAFARFRAKLSGCMTPLVIWPHHFDMAFISFVTKQTDEHQDPHSAYGFAPFSDGLDRPYFYAYGWSQDTGYITFDVKAPAETITEGYTGLYLAYDPIKDDGQFVQLLEDIFLSYHSRASDLLS